MFYAYQLPLIYAYIFVPVISTKDFFLVQNNFVDEITSRNNPNISIFKPEPTRNLVCFPPYHVLSELMLCRLCLGEKVTHSNTREYFL